MKIIEFKRRKSLKKYNFDKIDFNIINKADFNNILEEGEAVWRCNCGSVLFFPTPDGAKCQQCGIIAIGWID